MSCPRVAGHERLHASEATTVAPASMNFVRPDVIGMVLALMTHFRLDTDDLFHQPAVLVASSASTTISHPASRG
jgi:hypothetical protein